MNRKSKIKKSVVKNIFVYLVITAIIVAFGVYFTTSTLLPTAVTQTNVREGKYYSFKAIKAENIEKDEKSGYTYITLINEKNELMDVCVDTDKKAKAVVSASKEKPFVFKGKGYLQSNESIKVLQEQYKDRNITYVHPYGLIDRGSDWGIRDYLFPVMFLVLIIANIYPIIKSLKYKKKAIEFLDNNPMYNEREATRTIDKYVDVINEYIILMSATPAIINIRESSEFVLTRHRTYFVTTHFTLSLLDKEGKRRTYNVPKLKKEKAQELLDYIRNFDRRVASGV